MLPFEILGDQDGQPEKELKNALVPLLARASGIRKAALARIVSGSRPDVALILSGPDNPTLASESGTVFKERFATGEYLTIAFVPSSQEREVLSKCTAFYASANVSDWFLASTEGYGLDVPRACAIFRFYQWDNGREAAQVRLDPPMNVSLVADHIPRQALLITRLFGVTFQDRPPIAVHVADMRLGTDNPQSIAWGELYLTRAAALRAVLNPGYSEHRLFGTLIVVFSLPSIAYWVFRLLPFEVSYPLLEYQHGSPLVRAIWSTTTRLAFVSPVFFGVSLWMLRSMWATLSMASRVCLSVFVAATGSIVILLLFGLLVITTGNFK